MYAVPKRCAAMECLRVMTVIVNKQRCVHLQGAELYKADVIPVLFHWPIDSSAIPNLLESLSRFGWHCVSS